jgi:hypothetical protein
MFIVEKGFTRVKKLCAYFLGMQKLWGYGDFTVCTEMGPAGKKSRTLKNCGGVLFISWW